MWLTKDGITMEVTHPSDIARFKKLGYVEHRTAVSKPEPEAPQIEEPAPTEPVAPVEPAQPKKGKGKKAQDG